MGEGDGLDTTLLLEREATAQGAGIKSEVVIDEKRGEAGIPALNLVSAQYTYPHGCLQPVALPEKKQEPGGQCQHPHQNGYVDPAIVHPRNASTAWTDAGRVMVSSGPASR